MGVEQTRGAMVIPKSFRGKKCAANLAGEDKRKKVCLMAVIKGSGRGISNRDTTRLGWIQLDDRVPAFFA